MNNSNFVGGGVVRFFFNADRCGLEPSLRRETCDQWYVDHSLEYPEKWASFGSGVIVSAIVVVGNIIQ